MTSRSKFAPNLHQVVCVPEVRNRSPNSVDSVALRDGGKIAFDPRVALCDEWTVGVENEFLIADALPEFESFAGCGGLGQAIGRTESPCGYERPNRDIERASCHLTHLPGDAENLDRLVGKRERIEGCVAVETREL